MAPTVILGAGIIGVSTAYYLSKEQEASSIHLVEASPKLFASASGFAGGFLSKDWYSPAAAELGALSFEEHRRLAEQENGAERWGYAPSTALTLSRLAANRANGAEKVDVWFRHGGSRAEAAPGSTDSAHDDVIPPRWLCKDEGDSLEVIGGPDSVAQLDPLRLCHFLLDECRKAGVHLHHPAKAVSIETDTETNKLSSVRIAYGDTSTTSDIPCSNIVIAAGCWSSEVFQTLFPQSTMTLPLSSLAGHSLVVKSPRWNPGEEDQDQTCHAVFLTAEPGYSPELFSRRSGYIYVGGLNSATEPLPRVATDARKQLSSEALHRLRQTCRDVLQEDSENDLQVVREGLCFRPVTTSGLPLVFRVSDRWTGLSTEAAQEGGGVYVATGHGPWGISMSLGTGKVVAEMVQGKEPSADVSKLGLDG